MTLAYLDRSGVKVWYDTVGTGGPALLVIQGLGYSLDASWRVLPGLSERRTVVVLDNRGVGRSDVPEESFQIADLAGDAAAALDASGLGPVHVAGFSMGGLVAQELALSRPDLVRTLTVGCTSPGGKEAIPLSSEVAEQFTDWGNLPPREAALRAARVCYADTTSSARIDADVNVRMRYPTDRKGYLAQLSAVGHYGGAASRLGQLKVPVLIAHGTDDLIVPVANAKVLRRYLPHAETAIFRGAGHILMTDAETRLTDTMVDFMERHDTSTVGWSERQ